MKLSDITTADALILNLAAQGYTKVLEDRDLSDQLKGHAVGLYSYGEYECPHCANKLRQVDIWPCGIGDCGSAGFSAVLNATLEIIEWFAFETYAGTVMPLNPDSELDRVVAAIDSWLSKEVN
jgi:hypothetical protein